MFFTGGVVYAATVEEQILELKKNIYGFNVCSIPEREKAAKGEKLDTFWKYIESNKPESLVVLRKLLRSEVKDGYFLVDAAGLLASQSTEKDDLNIVLNALEKGSPCGTNQQFFGLANHLSLHGLDVYPIVEKILLEPKFNYFMRDHFLTIEKRETVVLLLFRMDAGTYTSRLKSFLIKNQKNESLVMLVADILHLSADNEIDKFLTEFSGNLKNSKLRDYITAKMTPWKPDEKYKITLGNLNKREIENHIENLIMRKYKEITVDIDVFKKDIAFQIKRDNIPYLNEAIKKVARRVSNEGLDELYYLLRLRLIATAGS